MSNTPLAPSRPRAPRPGRARLAATSTLTVALGAACTAPAPPPAPDERLRPPLYSSADCSAVTPLARQEDVTTNAFLADLDEGRSCEVFLEQDECVLAIFRDCTGDARQWIGEATQTPSSVDVTLSPLFERAPPRTPPRVCTGTYDDPSGRRASVRLDCDGETEFGLYLERKDFDVKPFAKRMPDEQLSMGSFGTIDALPDMLSVRVGTGSQLWVAVNWTGGGAGGGVYRVQGTPTSPTIEQVADVSRPRLLAASPEGRVAAGTGKDISEDMDLQLYDANVVDPRTARLATATTADSILAIAGASGDRFAVASRPRSGTISGVSLYTYDAQARRLRRGPQRYTADNDDLVVQALVWSKPAKVDAVAFVLAMTRTGSDEGVLVGLDDELREVWRVDDRSALDVRAMATLPGRGRVAIILAGGERDYDGPDQSNHYYEVDPSNGAVGPLVPLPFADTEELSYDAARDRVFVVQRFGAIGYVDRTGDRVRAAQGYFKLDRPAEHTDVIVTALAWDPGRQRLVIADPKRGVLDSLEVVAP